MNPITFTKRGMVFIIRTAIEAGAIHDAAKRYAISLLNEMDEARLLVDFHDNREKNPIALQDGPCGITIENGGYSDATS